MPRKFVDLSIYLENDVLSDPPAFAPKIEYFTHENTFSQIAPFFPGLRKEDLPDGEGWAVERVSLSTHNGTHLDAPYHFHSTMNRKLGEKERAIAIDEVPLEWCFQPGVKLDFRHFGGGYVSPPATWRTSSGASATRCSRWRSWWSTRGPAPATASRTTCPAAAAWATRPPCTCWSAACA
jgi:kynurenine formamidase